MSEVSARDYTVNCRDVYVPAEGEIRNLYDLLRRIETDASAMGINTKFDDWATYEVTDEGITVTLRSERP